MLEDFKECTIGSLIIGGVLAVVITIIVAINNPDAIGAGIGAGTIYLIYSIVMYGFLMMSRNMLDQYGGTFILGTIVMTAGGWWLGHGMAFIFVKIQDSLKTMPVKRRNKPLYGGFIRNFSCFPDAVLLNCSTHLFIQNCA